MRGVAPQLQIEETALKRMLINATDPEESRIAVVEDGVLQEMHVEIANRDAYLGNIYKGRVVNIEPSIGAAFVSFGGRTNGFLHASDVLPAYAREGFELSDVTEGRARLSSDDGPDSVRAALDDDEESTEDADTSHSEGDARADAEEAGHDGASQDDESPEETDEERFGFGAGDEDDSDEDARDDDVEDDADDEEEEEEESSEEGAAPRARRSRSRGGRKRRDDQGGEPADTATVDAEPDSKRGGSRGRRGRRGGRANKPSNGPNRRVKTPIDQLVRKGQEVICQVTKEGIGAKGPTLTTFVSLPGRSLVLMPSLPKCGVSRKIDDPKERRRLKRVVRDLDETGNGGVGFIVRTAGVGKSKADLQRDRDYLKKIWELVAKRVDSTRAPALLYQESDLVLKAMRDLFSPDIQEVVCDSKDVYLRIKDFAEKLMPHMAERIKLHEITTPLFHSFGIEQEVQKLYQPRVELANGGSIVIDQAEALVAIDVNSGKFKPGTDLEETAYRTNLEVIPEIVRQLRLRDLGGLIVIDFIDMNHERHRRGVERKLIDELKGDRARIKVGKISPFGMMELTRQRVGPGLKHTVFNTCTHCGGSGLVRTVQSKALSVLREIAAIIGLKGFSALQAFVSPAVNDFLVNYKRRTLLDLEERLGKSIMIRPEPRYPVEMVHYRFLTGDGQEARVAIPAGLGVRTASA